MIAVYLCENPPVFDFGLTCNGWPVFSPRMQSLIEDKAPGLVEFLPFRFQRPDGTGQVTGYCVGQILKLVDCLDRSRTKVRDNWEPLNSWGDFGTLRPFFLTRSLIGNEMLFRIKGKCGSIIIREDLKSIIENGGVGVQRFDLVDCS